MEIAPGYTVGDWAVLNLSASDAEGWTQAIKIFETRIRRRFIDPVDVLIKHELGQGRGSFGFAILAIDCLLVETLQRFRDGRLDKGGNGKLIQTFLSERLSPYFDDGAQNGSKADIFYRRCRCGIHHSGQTDGDFRVKRSGPLITFKPDGSVTVNRTAFHRALKQEFDAYLIELADPHQMTTRENFKKKMDAVCLGGGNPNVRIPA